MNRKSTMSVTQSKTRRQRTSRKSRPTTTRPVQEMLLDLAYRLHATRVVGVLPAATTVPA